MQLSAETENQVEVGRRARSVNAVDSDDVAAVEEAFGTAVAAAADIGLQRVDDGDRIDRDLLNEDELRYYLLLLLTTTLAKNGLC